MTKIQKDNKNVAKVPNLRFTEFTEEWETKKLGEIGEIVNGLTYSPNDIAENGVLVLRSSNVQNRSLAFEDNVYVGTDNYNPVQENDILICVRNGSKNLIGKNALINKENEGIAFGAFMSIYRSSFNRFLFHWFDTNEYKEIVHKNLGATINSINGSDLRKFKVPFPSVEEQNKLASFLSLVDERIQTQNKIIEQLETLIKGLSEKLFLQEIRFKEFTDKWELKKLGDISTITTGSSNREDSILNGEYTFFDRSQDIRTSSRFLFDKEAVIVPGEGQEFIPKYFIGKFDLHQRTYAIFDFRGINGKYLYYHLLNDDKYLQSQAVGSTVKSLRLPMFQSMPIKSPCLDEQTTIANFLSVIETKIQTEKNILDKYHCQKQYLLQNLFI